MDLPLATKALLQMDMLYVYTYIGKYSSLFLLVVFLLHRLDNTFRNLETLYARRNYRTDPLASCVSQQVL